MRPSDWPSALKIGDGLCRKLVGKLRLVALLSVLKDVSKWRGGDVLMSQYVLREGCHERQQASQECAEANARDIRASGLNRSREPHRKAS